MRFSDSLGPRVSGRPSESELLQWLWERPPRHADVSCYHLHCRLWRRWIFLELESHACDRATHQDGLWLQFPCKHTRAIKFPPSSEHLPVIDFTGIVSASVRTEVSGKLQELRYQNQ